MLVLKDVKLSNSLVVSSHVLTLKYKVNLETAVCFSPEAAKRAVVQLKAVVLLRVLVSVHERTPPNIL